MNTLPELCVEQLRRTIDPQTLNLQTTEQLAPLTGIIGQQRAVAALRFGLGIHNSGFNIYVAGSPGIGKMTAVRAFLADLARAKATPPDWCYLNNFDDPYQPRAYQLPAGRGRSSRICSARLRMCARNSPRPLVARLTSSGARRSAAP